MTQQELRDKLYSRNFSREEIKRIGKSCHVDRKGNVNMEGWIEEVNHLFKITIIDENVS